VLGIPVIDGDPVEVGAEVPLGLAHEVAGEPLEVRHLHCVVGRDDEAEVVAVSQTRAPVGSTIIGEQRSSPAAVSPDRHPRPLGCTSHLAG
jgi:hypothetical protein